jgi:hypothetical protein
MRLPNLVPEFGPIDKRLSHSPFTGESRVRIPLGLLNSFTMKKIVLFLLIAVSTSSCLWTPMNLSNHNRRLYIHQNYPRQYYYQLHPTRKQRYKPGKIYKPYFRPGRY